MRKYILILSLILIISGCKFGSKDDGWSLSTEVENKITKKEGTITYFVDPQMSIDDRNDIIKKTTEYIKQNLTIIGESDDFNDPLYVVIARDRAEMGGIAGLGGAKNRHPELPENLVQCIPRVLKHELMHVMSQLRWGHRDIGHPQWLEEGLAVYAGPEAEPLPELTLEEKYAYFYKIEKLLTTDLLIIFPSVEDRVSRSIPYIQSGYIVQFLIERYGIQKLKEFWVENSDFEKIYGMSFNDLIMEINKEISQKYSDPVELDWEKYCKEVAG